MWQLDYSRSSDVYDSVGYWHVEPLDDQRCIVYYTQDLPLPCWILTLTLTLTRTGTLTLKP